MRTVLLGLVVVLAGCSGPALQGATTTPTATPAPVPTVEDSYPPGMAPDGVADASALAAAHRESVRDRSHTLVVFERERVGEPALGSHFVGNRTIYRIGADGAYNVTVFKVNTRGNGALTTQVPTRSRYGNRTAGFVRAATGDGPAYRRGAERPDIAALGADYVERYLAVENATVRPRRDGGVRVKSADPTAHPNASSYFVDADVGPDGTLQRLHVEYVDADDTVRFLTVRVSDVGSTAVTRPAWVREAVAATNGSGATRNGSEGT